MSNRIGDWCCTYSGVSFYPLDPRPDEVRIEDIAHALSLLCRFGGHSREFYSVAEHSVRVMDAFVRRTGFRNDGTGNGTPGAVLAALLHDASEAYLVDVPRPIKRYLGMYQDIEHKVQSTIYDRFNIDGYDRSHAAIKACDNILLATEKRDLMPERTWNDEPIRAWAPLPDPLPERIAPWSPREAEANFLAAFERAADALVEHIAPNPEDT